MPVEAIRRAPRIDSRRQNVLDAAARLFGRNGFAGATVRDIAAAAGMLPGSIYYHFPSKEDLLVAVYEEGVDRIVRTVEKAINRRRAPWKRLEAACRAHLESVLDRSDYALVVVRVHPGDVPAATSRLTALRDGYEALFRDLVDDLDLAGPARAKYARLMLIGTMNWTQTWYHAGDDTPEAIARHFVAVLRGERGAERKRGKRGKRET